MRITTVVVGAGQAGLAMSHQLRCRGIDHVLLERGRTANSWHTERWDSLRLLTPNWLSRLPGYPYRGPDPDGYMTASEVAAHLAGYRESISAPVYEGVEVTGVRRLGDGYLVSTNQGVWTCRTVVIATGACSDSYVPALAAAIPHEVRQLTSLDYRSPGELDEGGVLVVGASSSGVQLADEIQRSGRQVTLAVGEHTRVPRTYRGRDIHWWLDAIGQLDERHDEVDDLTRGRRMLSLQLIGTPERRAVDLNALSALGVRLMGRLAGVSGGLAQMSGSLVNMCVSADLKQGRLLDRLDEWADVHRLECDGPPGDRPAPTVVPTPSNALDLTNGSIRTVIWATGFRPRFPWLDDRFLDRKGQPLHEGGVAKVPGLYVLGFPFTRRRKSGFLDGVGPDAVDLAAHLQGHLDLRSTA
ncbi:NAD(P)-binding domain-containing protein [Streptomyces sp. Lzd4kr]|nr:NAD(P)-binding domain-containing protein [Streptomyces sp. Lzd4kr]